MRNRPTNIHQPKGEGSAADNLFFEFRFLVTKWSMQERSIVDMMLKQEGSIFDMIGILGCSPK